MKKTLLAALAVLCVSALQAVTLTWNNTGTAFDGFTYSGDTKAVWSGNFSITVNFTATSTPVTVFQLLTANGANKAGELRFNSNNWSGNVANFGTYNGNASATWVNSNGDFSNDRVVSADGSKSNTIKLTFDGYNAETKKYSSLKYDIIFANGDQQSWTMNNGNLGFGMDEISWTSLATGDGVTINSMTLEATNVVPEPTALALLALGVAGLALRRRA